MCGICDAAAQRRAAAEQLLAAVAARPSPASDCDGIFRPIPIGPEWWPLLRRFDPKT